MFPLQGARVRSLVGKLRLTSCLPQNVAPKSHYYSEQMGVLFFFNIYALIWASLVAQLVKNPPTMRATWIQSLGWEDALEKGKATHSSILAWRIPWIDCGVAKSRTQLSNFHFTRAYLAIPTS